MQTSESIDQVMSALLNAVAAMGAVPETKRNTFTSQAYADLDDYMGIVGPALEANDLLVVSSTERVQVLEPRETKREGVVVPALVEMRHRLLHASGQWIEVGSASLGQDTTDKAVLIAQTYGRKAGLAQLFNLVTKAPGQGQAQNQRPADNGPRTTATERRGGQQAPSGTSGATRATQAGQEARTTTAAADPRIAQVLELAKAKYGAEANRQITEALKVLGEAMGGQKFASLKAVPGEGLDRLIAELKA